MPLNRGAPGLSAYQIAVKNGFTGTEIEWLASLQGSSGGSSLTADVLSALSGTVSNPASDNKFVTNADPRNADTRAPQSHAHSPSDVTGTAVVTNDSRLSDSRTPLTHAHAASEVTGTAVVTNDSRLSDARTPTAHSQAISTVTNLQTNLDGKAASSHAHAPSEITGTAVITNDARLSDARTPTTHSHAISDVTNLTTTLSGKETANANIQTHVTAAHAPSGAQANADITKAEIEAKLTGEISTHTHAGGSGGLGYTINVQSLTSSPTDAQTVYFGMLPKAPTTTANISKIYIRKAGTIKIAEIYCYSGTAGTNEAWSLYIRKNNTTDTLIATLSLATSERIFTNSSLSIAVTAGDYVEIKGIQPTWATNPLTCIYGGYIYVE